MLPPPPPLREELPPTRFIGCETGAGGGAVWGLKGIKVVKGGGEGIGIAIIEAGVVGLLKSGLLVGTETRLFVIMIHLSFIMAYYYIKILKGIKKRVYIRTLFIGKGLLDSFAHIQVYEPLSL
jgi:hypothetical protein